MATNPTSLAANPTMLARYRAMLAQQAQAQGQPTAFDPSGDTAQSDASSPALAPPPAAPAPSVYGSPVAAPAYSNAPLTTAQSIQNEQGFINAGGQQINQEAQGALDYYSPLQQQATGNVNSALSALQQTPGYTPQEAGQINVNYGDNNTSSTALGATFLTPDEQTSIMGNPGAGVAENAAGVDAEGQQLSGYGQSLGAQVANNANYTGAGVDALTSGVSNATGALNTGVTGAANGLASGLQGAQGGFSSLNEAVNNPALAFDPNSTENQITDAQVQQMRTNAGQAVGSQYQAAEDQLYKTAAAAGNTSPLAIAAANARLQSQEAAGEGNAESNAYIQALQAQEQQATSIEQQREGAVQTQTGLKANAATTEQSQAQAAAGLAGTSNLSAQELAGTTGVSAAENVGNATLGAAQQEGQTDINAANTYGQTAINESNTINNTTTAATTLAEQQAQARAASIAGNRQTAQTNVNNTAFTQGDTTQGQTAAGAQAVGNARISGNNSYIAGEQGQQSSAQQGGENALSTQQGAYGTETSGLGTATNTQSNFNLGKASQSLGTAINSGIGQAIGSLPKAAGGGSAAGDVFTEPTIQRIGEAGPELVLPLKGRYRNNERQAA